MYFSVRYSEVANNIQKEETVQTIQFVLLDCQPLKFALLQVNYCIISQIFYILSHFL